MRRFDALVIGAGSAGLTVATGLAGFGRSVGLIERRHVGGDCTNVGCVPSKTLIHLSRIASGRTPAEVLAEVRRRRDELRDEEARWVEDLDGVELIRGEARFRGERELEVSLETGGSERLGAEHIVIATGSSPIVPSVAGLPDRALLTNESLFDLDDLPAHLAIVGAGTIGSEMAFAFRRLGSRVTLIDLAPRVLSTLEPEVGELIRERMEAAGIEVLVHAKATRYDDSGDGAGELIVEQRGRERRLDGVDRVLMAVGRRPNLDALELDAAGVETTEAGVVVNGWGRSGVRGIYAIGDVHPNSAFTHSANAQGRRLVQKIALPLSFVGSEPFYPSATFTEPEVAQVGPTLADLQRRWHPELIRSLRVELADTDRGYTQGLERGFVRIHALRLSGRVLSATIVAPAASEMIPLLTLAVNRRLSLYALANLVFPYPTLSEAVKKAASEFVFTTLPALPRELGAWLRWRFAGGRDPDGRNDAPQPSGRDGDRSQGGAGA